MQVFQMKSPKLPCLTGDRLGFPLPTAASLSTWDPGNSTAAYWLPNVAGCTE